MALRSRELLSQSPRGETILLSFSKTTGMARIRVKKRWRVVVR